MNLDDLSAPRSVNSKSEDISGQPYIPDQESARFLSALKPKVELILFSGRSKPHVKSFLNSGSDIEGVEGKYRNYFDYILAKNKLKQYHS